MCVPPVVSVNNAGIVSQSATLTASGANTYSWSNGSAGSNIAVSPTTPYIHCYRTAAGGTNSASATVTVNPNLGFLYRLLQHRFARVRQLP